MISDALYVWVYLPGATEPVIAGRLEVNRGAAGCVGHFNYGQSYLSRSDAVAIDPVALPLKPGVTSFTGLNGYPGAILDACPDAWGKRVTDRLHGKQVFPSGYLKLNDAGRAGCLAFSETPESSPSAESGETFELAELMAAARAVETNEPVADALLNALSPGSGGARPKCMVVLDDATWIAKFVSAEDRFISIPRLEHATMLLARRCGVDAAETRMHQINGQDICLVRRFDRVHQNGQITRRGFLSARTVFYDDPSFAAVATGSYQRLARWMPRFGADRADKEQLFKRMVFNVVVRNDYDHDQNHGLVHEGNGRFVLAPAYDIVPNLQPRSVNHHALLIGDSAAGTTENLMGIAESFGLGKDKAFRLVQAIEAQVLDHWQEVFYEAGFGDEDIRKVAPIMRPIPQHAPGP